MENITTEVIIELYTKYQLYDWWVSVGVICSTAFGLLGLIFFVSGLANDMTPLQITGAVFLACFVASLIVALRCSYLINVVLKPEIAAYVVPAGFDLAERAGREVSQMWDVLKGLLNK